MKKSDKSTITKVLKQEISSLIFVYIFGSQATNEATEESDFDIAFYSEENLDALQRFEIQELIAKNLSKNVDLIDLKNTNTVLQFQVVSSGIEIFSKNLKFSDQFADLTFSKYLKDKEDAFKTEAHKESKGESFICLNCHDPHGGQDKFFVRTKVQIEQSNILEKNIRGMPNPATEIQDEISGQENIETDIKP